MENFTLSLNETLLSLLTLIITWGLAQLTKYIKSKTEKIKQESLHTKIDKYLELTVSMVLDTVRALNATVVKALKEKSADGKLTDEEKEEVLEEAVDTIMESLSINAKTVLENAYGDLPTWVRIQVENAVLHQKNMLNNTKQ